MIARLVTSRRAASLVLLVLLTPAPASPGDLQEDLRARRARVMEQLGPDAMLILWSAPARLYSLDVHYEYRQESNLLYLSGIDQEDTILVLMPGNRSQKEMLFVRDPNPRREHWEGHSLTQREAAEASGIETVYLTSQFEPFLAAMLSQRRYGRTAPEEYEAFFAALAANRARLAMLLEPVRDLTSPLDERRQFGATLRQRFSGIAALQDAGPMIARLRQVKTGYEQKVLARSVEISAEAHMAGMRAARPGRYEYEVEAAIEAVYLSNGAMSWGYPSIVGSGPNATILHYNESARRMEDGDLLLVDAAANYQGLTGDITRTYPVNGTFSDAQKDLYRIVLAAQEAGMKAAAIGATAADISRAAEEVVKAGLLKLGLITDASGNQFRTWYTHGIVHWIGMDVHDVGPMNRPFEPGMAFVIEPGLYIREAALENLPATPENRAFIEKVRPAVARYRNLGVRVEDSFLITEQGLQRLSAKVPRTIDEIERLMRSN